MTDLTLSFATSEGGFKASVPLYTNEANLHSLLSAYDLLTSGYVPEGTYDAGHVNALLSQAKTLGDNLKVQFDTESGLPTANINFTSNTAVNGQFTDPLNNVTYNSTNTAVAGTLVLEFYRLADLTGDSSFRDLVSLCTVSNKATYSYLVC